MKKKVEMMMLKLFTLKIIKKAKITVVLIMMMITLVMTLYPLRVIRQLSTSIGLYPAPFSTNLNIIIIIIIMRMEIMMMESMTMMRLRLLGLLCHYITNNLIRQLWELSRRQKKSEEKRKKMRKQVGGNHQPAV